MSHCQTPEELQEFIEAIDAIVRAAVDDGTVIPLMQHLEDDVRSIQASPFLAELRMPAFLWTYARRFSAELLKAGSLEGIPGKFIAEERRLIARYRRKRFNKIVPE
ncbi:hypothetical protein HYPSUDRAFT_57894, partial [Hypholoma sublateritium FD-334 SS-4]